MPATASSACGDQRGNFVALVDLESVQIRRPDRVLIERLSLSINPGDRIGIVGLNGCGKSSLLRVMAGVDEPDAGVVRFGRDARIGFIEQVPQLSPGTVRSAVGEGWEASAALDRLGMTPFVDQDVSTLSGGQTKRTALAAKLVREHDLLLVDEPTNHLDLGAIDWIEEWLLRFQGGLVLVTHDRHLLDRLTNRIVEIDRGGTYVHAGGYGAYLEARALRDEQAATNEQARRNLARTELAWLRRGAPARTRKPKARIDAAKATIDARPQAAARGGHLDLAQLGTTRLGSKVIELSGISHRYGDLTVLRDLDLDIEPGDRIGIVGDNGVGKSTLLDIVAGRLTPTAGTIDIGSTVRVGYLDQRGLDLDPTLRVRNAVAGPHREPNHEDSRLLERFWFTGDTQWAPIGQLSGGERHRLQLVLLLAEKPNVLLLDEPTNDLDLDTLRVLEDFLNDWPGAVVTVSHDRTFLDRVVDFLFVADGSGALRELRGGVAGWLAERATTPRSTSVAPKSLSGTRPPKQRTQSTLKRLLDQAEKALTKATRERDAAAAALIGVGHPELVALAEKLAKADAAVIAAEEAWIALAEEAEQ